MTTTTSKTVGTIGTSAAMVASIASTIAATLGTTPAGQDAEILAQIAEDIGVDAGAASFQDILQAAINGQYGDQAAKLVLMQVTPEVAATAAAEQYAAHWDDTYAALGDPQKTFDALSGGATASDGKRDDGIFGRIRHDERGHLYGLVDALFAFEAVRRAVWKLAHQAAYALLTLKHPEWAGKITNEDLTPAAA